MARFTSPDGVGAPGPTGPTGADGADGVGVPAGGAAGNILAKIDGTDYNTEWIENYTSTVKHLVKYVGNSTIPIGTPVYTVLNGNSSTNIPVNVASNTSEATSSKTMGLVEESVAKNGFVYVITEGLLEGVDTSAANTGDAVWLGQNGAYIFGLANKPAAPAHLVFLGIVTRGQQVNGEIFVKVQNGFELEELHTVSLEATASIADNEVLAFDSASGLWKNQTAAEAGLATSAPLTLTQSSNHSSYPLTISSSNQQNGGSGYSDILKMINSKSGVTNPNKFVRLSDAGNLEILNSAYDAVNFLISDAGDMSVRNNITANGFIRGSAAGSVLKDIMLGNSELNVISTTIAQTTSNVNFITYNYTPVSSSSYLLIQFHLSKYILAGSMDDSYFSVLAVDGNEISYGHQNFNDDAGGSNNRSGVLFPLMGRYTNSSTSAKQIQLAARRISADDSITIDNSSSAIWLRITEVAR